MDEHSTLVCAVYARHQLEAPLINQELAASPQTRKFIARKLNNDRFIIKFYSHQDTTKKGYVLGAPENRTHTAPERHLSARAVCILRALLHSALIWATCNNQSSLEAIASLVTPQMLAKDLPEFFWAHLEKDLELLGRDTGKGLDEVVMIMHLVLRQILTTDPPIGLFHTIV